MLSSAQLLLVYTEMYSVWLAGTCAHPHCACTTTPAYQHSIHELSTPSLTLSLLPPSLSLSLPHSSLPPSLSHSPLPPSLPHSSLPPCPSSHSTKANALVTLDTQYMDGLPDLYSNQPRQFVVKVPCKGSRMSSSFRCAGPATIVFRVSL